MSYKILTILSACIFLLAATAPQKSADNISLGRDLVKKCQENGPGTVEVEGSLVFCAIGKLQQTSLESLVTDKRKLKFVVADTPGGVGSVAIELGRRIFIDRARLIVGGKCLSSCGNYLAPAASTIVVLKGGVIGMHGSALRGVIEYAAAVNTRETKSATGTAHSTREAFAQYRATELAAEQSYFQDILKDDAYLTRYTELMRSFRIKHRGKCKLVGQHMLILDRAYLNEFGISVSEWEEESNITAQIAVVGTKTPINILAGLEGRAVHIAESSHTCPL